MLNIKTNNSTTPNKDDIQNEIIQVYQEFENLFLNKPKNISQEDFNEAREKY